MDARVEVMAESLSEAELERLTSEMIAPFRIYFYAYEDLKLSNRVVELLEWTKSVVSTAESLTGGALAASIVELPHVSDIFYEGIVAYNPEAKMRRLGVRESTIERHTVYSREVACEMVEGLLRSGATVGVSTTGIAGPSGATPGKPVGTVYIGVGGENDIEVFKHHFEGDRGIVRASAVNMALFYLYKFLNGDIIDLKLLAESQTED
jgi:nicotinamide-nucleotide amidase